MTHNDRVKIAAAVAAVACTGLIATSIHVGKKMEENRHLKQVKTLKTEEAALGQTLRMWNRSYFNTFGLEAQLEVSESALRNDAEKAGEEGPDFVRRRRTIVEKTPLVFLRKDLRERRDEEKKFMVVLNPVEKASELVGSTASAVELDADPQVYFELPAEEVVEIGGEGICEAPSDVCIKTGDSFVDPARLDLKTGS